MASVWRPGKGMKVTKLAPNLFIFKFFNEVDINRVIEDDPWAFEQSLLVLQRLDPKVTPFDMTLNMAELWVQAHYVPSNFFTEKVAQVIGESIGTFIRVDRKNFEGSWKTFLRIRVLVDITKPLRRKMKMKKQGGDWSWVDFKYERLPNFCFLYGIIGHTERFCHLLFEGVDEGIERPYDSWLRATSRRPPVFSSSQWLIPDNPQRPASDLSPIEKVEMVETGARTQYMYENQRVRTVEGYKGQANDFVEVSERSEGRDKVVAGVVTKRLDLQAQITGA